MLLIFFSTKAQTYEIRRVDDYKRNSASETIRYIGGIQSQMQSRYDSNYQKISNEINHIKQEINNLPFDYNIKKNILTRFINVCLKNVDNSGINMTSNSDVIKAINYMYSSVNSYINEEKTGKIGINFIQENEFFKITDIIYGGSAWRDSQLKIGDVILKVGKYGGNLINIRGMDIDEVVDLVKGEKGTKLKLLVQKSDGTIREIISIRE